MCDPLLQFIEFGSFESLVQDHERRPNLDRRILGPQIVLERLNRFSCDVMKMQLGSFKDCAARLTMVALIFWFLEPPPQDGNPDTVLLAVIRVLVQQGGRESLGLLFETAFYRGFSSVSLCHHMKTSNWHPCGTLKKHLSNFKHFQAI